MPHTVSQFLGKSLAILFNTAEFSAEFTLLLAATQKYGILTTSGTGALTSFTIAHGLGATPSSVIVTAGSAAAATPFFAVADSTNITVTYTTAPVSGTNNVKLNWLVKK